MPKFKIVLDRDKCMGDGNCVDLAPETFGVDEDDKSFVINPAGNWPEYVIRAAKDCPADAITLYDGETGERIWPKEDKRAGKTS